MIIEIARSSPSDLQSLLAQQGKFEAKIGNDTVFIGGRDITYVCRSADCSGIDPSSGCGQSGDAWFCRFMFSISLSPAAAEKQAELTKDLDTVVENKEEYL